MDRVERLTYVVGGTLVIHAAIAAVLAVYEPPEREVLLFPPRQIELVDLMIEKPPEPPPPPPAAEPEPEPEPEEAPPPKVTRTAPRTEKTERQPPPVTTAEPPPPGPDPGPGAPVLKMENLGEGTSGVAVAPGRTTKGRKGGGGSGGGPGTGTGMGTGTGAPVSVASIKTRAKPKGDYGYFDARKDYPAEARQLGVEGQVKVRLTVDERGRVTAAKLLNRLGHGLDELALERARMLEFEPAIDTDDRPVSSVVVWTFTFTLPA